MAWPASVITREISFGKAVVLETGQDLSLRVSTRASRSLVSLAEGFRMEALVAAFEASEPGDEIVFPLPVTNQPGWADAATRQGIEVGEDEHSHLYTTTLTIYNGSSQIRQYTIGPYPVPQGEGVLDGDTMLVPSGTQPGALVPLPEIWAEIIADANAILNLRGEPSGIATLDEDGRVPESEIPMRAIADSPELNNTIAQVSGAEGMMPRSIVGEVPADIGWPADYPVRPSVRIDGGGNIRGSIGWSPHEYFDLFSDARTNPDNTFYVNRGGVRTIDGVEWAAGVWNNSGASPAEPISTLHHAIEAANSAGGSARIVVAADRYVDGYWQNPAGGAKRQPDNDLAIVVVGGTLTTGSFRDFTASPTVGYSECFDLAYSYNSPAVRIVDWTVVDADGVAAELVQVASVAECAATPGSYYPTNNAAMVHRLDGQAPTAENTEVVTAGSASIFTTGVNLYIGCEGRPENSIKMIGGGTTGNITIGGSASQTVDRKVAILDIDELAYAGYTGALGGHSTFRTDSLVVGRGWTGLVACFNTLTVAPAKDGFNLHTQNSPAVRPALLTVNCKGVDIGRPVSASDTSNNGLTLHDYATGIDIAGDYRRTRGGAVHNIGSSRHYMLGTIAADDQGDTPWGGSIPPTSFRTSAGSARLYLEACRAGGRTTDYAYSAVDGSTIYLRDCPRPAMQVEGDVRTY